MKKNSIITFIGDFFNKGATVRKDKFQITEIPSILGISITTFLSINGNANSLITPIFGDYGDIILLVMFLASLFFSGLLIYKKERKEWKVYYQYNQLVRNTAKFLFILLLVFIPFISKSTFRKYSLLPPEITGYVYCPGKNPVANALIDIVGPDKEKLSADGIWKTDNAGFFLVVCRKRVFRSSMLRILNESTNTYTYVPLSNYNDAENLKQRSTTNIYEIEKCD